MSRYQEIADDLRRRIAAAEFSADSKLPSISDLQEQYETPSLNTIRSAQAVLAREGLLRRRHGDGVYVVEPKHPPADVTEAAGESDPIAIARAAIKIAHDALWDAESCSFGYIVAESIDDRLRFTDNECVVFSDLDTATQHVVQHGRQHSQVFALSRIEVTRDESRPPGEAELDRPTDVPVGSAAERFPEERPVLTPRELAALRAWFTSSSKGEAAASLGISPKTLDTYITRARTKYSSVSRTAPTKSQLARETLTDGYITLADLEPRP